MKPASGAGVTASAFISFVPDWTEAQPEKSEPIRQIGIQNMVAIFSLLINVFNFFSDFPYRQAAHFPIKDAR